MTDSGRGPVGRLAGTGRGEAQSSDNDEGLGEMKA